MKTTSLFALSGLALSSALMADQPAPKDAVEIVPKIAICREAPVCEMPAPVSLLKQLKDMEANGDAIDSILSNEKLKTPMQKLKAPIVITSMEDAVKHLTRASVEKINIDFDQQQLAVFAWQGSGQDRLNGHLSRAKGAVANFQYHKGQTEDLRTHSTVFAMPKGTKMEVRELPRIIRCGVGHREMKPQIIPEGGLQVEPLKLEGAPAQLQLKVQPLQLQQKAK